MNEKLKDAENENDSDSDSSSSSSSDSGSSSTSAFGLKAGDAGKKKAKAKAKAKTKSKKEKESEPKREKEEEGGQSPRESGGKSDSGSSSMTPAALLEKGTSSVNAIQEITPWMIWSGGIKQKEIDSRMSKAIVIMSQLESQPGDSELAATCVKLTESVNRLSADSEIFHCLTSAVLVPEESHLTTSGEKIAQVLLTWTEEQVLTFLTDTGRKLCENLLTSSGEKTFFYKYVCAQDIEGWAFNLAVLLKANGEREDKEKVDKLVATVAQAQYNLVTYFLDKFRSLSGTVDSILKSIPMKWFCPEICRQGPFYPKSLGQMVKLKFKTQTKTKTKTYLVLST